MPAACATGDSMQPTGWWGDLPDATRDAVFDSDVAERGERPTDRPVGWVRVSSGPVDEIRPSAPTSDADDRARFVCREAGGSGDQPMEGREAGGRTPSSVPGGEAPGSASPSPEEQETPGHDASVTDAVSCEVSRETTRTLPAPPASGADEPAAPAKRRTMPAASIPAPAQTRVMTVANQKGGVGKTTTTVNVAAAMAQGGLRVLVIDIDPQGNASTALGIDHRPEVPSIYDVLVDGMALADIVQECPLLPGLLCAPATIDLAGAEIELVSLVARELRLKRAIDTYLSSLTEPLDYVLIDCPPSLGLLTVNAFVAAPEVFIPIQCEYYALEGLTLLLKNIELIRVHLNPELRVSTILMTMYDARTRLSAQVADEVRAHFPQEVLRSLVPRSVRISEAPSHGQTVMTYDPASSGALSYGDATAELAARAARRRVDGGTSLEPGTT